jgi:predicted nucleotidyltransferase
MNREAAIAALQSHEAVFKGLGVEHLYLFGSTAAGQAREGSDVDLFFDYQKGAFSLFDLMEVRDRASDILGCKADMSTRDSLHKTLRPKIEAAAVKIF